jgi:hypothetical protein
VIAVAPQMHPPWGEYFGVVSQSVATASAATEVEVTIVTVLQDPEEFTPAALQHNLTWKLQMPLYQPEPLELAYGTNYLQMCGPSENHCCWTCARGCWVLH